MMLQSFEVAGGPDWGRQNLPKLRHALSDLGLDGFLVPHEDEYQNEYLPEAHERLRWASGFTGSAGLAVVMRDRAALFVDGRYTLQAAEQVDGALFAIESLTDNGPATWLRANTQAGQRLGYDPKLHSPSGLKALEAAVRKTGAQLDALDVNPLDQAWRDRPAPPAAPLTVHALEFAGEAHDAKIARLSAALHAEGLDAAVITDPASIAWLFNVRGGDVAHTPLPLGRAIVYAHGRAALHMNPAKISEEVQEHLGAMVSVRSETAFQEDLSCLKNARVRVDPAKASAWVIQTLRDAGATLLEGVDPCALPRAMKNAVELEGARQAHMRDGAAVSQFLHWLSEEGQSGAVTEISAAQKLESFRRRHNSLEDLSFDTISGAGPNGAIVHYRVTTDSNRTLEPGSLYLVDSGGQYRDGTTDITRTIAIGTPSAEMQQRYTLVLKGHIALATIRFPTGTTGPQLDALARAPLWRAGLDYDHGTGHGVGSYLGVHEGPQRIHRVANTIPLEPGMIVSNEPGFYKTGAYGIRIENLQAVTPAEDIDGGRPMLGFETLTLAPLDRRLIIPDMLSQDEQVWVNAYHQRVAAAIGPQLSSDDRIWLDAACAPL